MIKIEEVQKESQEGNRKRMTRLNSNGTSSDKTYRLQELQDRLSEEKLRNSQLESKFEDIHHEMALKSIDMEQRIIKLKETLKKVKNGFIKNQQPLMELEMVEEAHSKLQGSIQEILKEASELASIKENEIVKNFDNKLSEICRELDEKRKKKTLEISLNKEKEEKYTAEAEMLKSSASYIESKNKSLEEQNKQLKVELKTRESETIALRKKLMAIQSAQKLRPESQSPLLSMRNALNTNGSASRSSSSDSRSQRYDSIVHKLKQLIEVEKCNLRAAKTAYTNEMEYKSEIEKILRACVDDIKQEILKKRGQLKKGELQGEKKIIIDELMNAEEMLNRIYDRAYPKSLLKR